MNNTCDLKKELCRKKAEAEKAEKAYSKYLANESFKNITLNNEELCKMIASMPRDEAVIVLNEILNSANFVSVFKHAINSSHKLDNLRKSKAAKAERRKAKMLSEQAELSEQNTPSDSFVYTPAETPTDFSQKWDQVNSLEQTDPPAYTGSIY